MTFNYDKFKGPNQRVSMNRLKETVAIIGTGQFGQAIANRCRISGATCSYNIIFGTRHSELLLLRIEEWPVTSIEQAIASADLVILAIPAAFLDAIAQYRVFLDEKVVIDVSNPSIQNVEDIWARLNGGLKGSVVSSAAECLQRHLERSIIVKALNTCSASKLTNAEPSEQLSTVAASNFPSGLEKVAKFCHACGFQVRCVPTLAYAKTLENTQRKVALYDWRIPAFIHIFIFCITLLYVLVKTLDYDHPSTFLHLVQNINSALAWTSITGLSLVYFPGAIIHFLGFIQHIEQVKVGHWLRLWLQMRRELGVLSAFETGYHILVSYSACILIMRRHNSHIFDYFPHSLP